MKHELLHLNQQFHALSLNGADPTLEIFLPYNMAEMGWQDKKRPCMIVCPGGGYGFCSEREAEVVALHFLPEGYNVFVLNYSVAPHRYPVQLLEVAATLELIHQNADIWNCDISRIAIIGFSAGGHLAANYSTKFHVPEVRAVFPESKPVHAAILSYPVITADMSFTHQGSILNLLGHEPSAEEVRAHSCELHVTPQTPPTFLWHTASDEAVPVANSLVYATALTKNHVPVELHIFPFGRHGLSLSNEQVCDEVTDDLAYDSAWIEYAKRWLKQYFRK